MTTRSESLWARSAPTYDAILAHPFLRGLADGSLPADAFAHYVTQDAHYLRDFARALALLAGGSPSAAETAMWARHAAGAVEVEQALHASLLDALGIDPAHAAGTPVAPTTRAYTSYLLATVATAGHAIGVAAVLPCYVVYREVGRSLAAAGSPDPRYRRWIETYADSSFDGLVREATAALDGATAVDDDAVSDAYATAMRYEWMFWEAAWQGETWPL